MKKLIVLTAVPLISIALLQYGCGKVEEPDNIALALEGTKETVKMFGDSMPEDGQDIVQIENESFIIERKRGEQPELDVMIGQMIMVGFNGAKVDNDSPIIKQVRQFHIGGVIFFDYNLETSEQIAELTDKLQKASEIPLFLL